MALAGLGVHSFVGIWPTASNRGWPRVQHRVAENTVVGAIEAPTAPYELTLAGQLFEVAGVNLSCEFAHTSNLQVPSSVETLWLYSYLDVASHGPPPRSVLQILG